MLLCVGRIIYLCLLFSPLVAAWPLRGYKRFEEPWWSYCVFATESAGALVIKLAQWASSRPDLFGEEVCERFKFLQDNTRPHGWAATQQALDASLGAGWSDGLQLERTPIGSGCIAQVYRGSVREGDAARDDQTRQVAVKVIHPGVREVIENDMALLRALGGALQSLPRLRWLNPKGMVDEVSKMLLMQLDLRVEAANLATFRRNFATDGAPPEVIFPEPLPGYVSADVLVESFVEGVPFLTWARAQKDDEAKHQVCNRGIDAVIKMLFLDNFVHGDLHPGNIFVTPAGVLV